MELLLEKIAILVNNNNFYIISPFLCLFAGIISSILPCSLSSYPLIIGYLQGTTNKTNSNKKKAIKLSLAFSLGLAITFTTLGVLAVVLGKFLMQGGKWWYLILGIIMVLMFLNMLDIISFPSIFKNDISTYIDKIFNKNISEIIGAILVGIIAAIFSSPCSTPVLITLLSLVSNSNNILWGSLLLLCYSLGHSFIIIIMGISLNFINNIISNDKYGIVSIILKYLLSFLILLLGLYMLYLGF